MGIINLLRTKMISFLLKDDEYIGSKITSGNLNNRKMDINIPLHEIIKTDRIKEKILTDYLSEINRKLILFSGKNKNDITGAIREDIHFFEQEKISAEKNLAIINNRKSTYQDSEIESENELIPKLRQYVEEGDFDFFVRELEIMLGDLNEVNYNEYILFSARCRSLERNKGKGLIFDDTYKAFILKHQLYALDLINVIFYEN